MNSTKPSALDEEAFMEDLLSGINPSFFDAAPSPDSTPRKRKKPKRELNNNDNAAENRNSEVMTPDATKKRPRPSYDAGDETLLEGAEDWDWDDMLSPIRKKPASNTVPPMPEADEPSFRCIVESIENCGSTKTLLVFSENKSEHRTIVLKDDWVETEVHTGDILNVIGSFSTVDQIITVSAKHNLLIQHPDTLVTATSVANAPHCARRPLLSLLMRSSSDKSRALVWGSMLHEVMQRCLSSQRWDASIIETFINESILKNLVELVHINVGVDEAKLELTRRAGGLKVFGEKFLSEIPKREAILSNTRDKQGAVTRLAITRLHDVEEEIWAPKYGLKGKIDASVEVRIDEYLESADSRQSMKPMHTRVTTMPLEIKTGHASAGMEHRAQTMLYTLLVAERYGTPLPAPISQPTKTTAPGGLLFYTQSEELIRVPSGWNEIRGLIITRNNLANYLKRRESRNKLKRRETDDHVANDKEAEDAFPFLPPTIDQDRACGRCYVSDACMLYRKAVEGVKDNCSPISELYELKTGHLSDEQLRFFKHWENLISLEEQDITHFRKELWTVGANEREKMGRCLNNMIIDPTFVSRDVPNGGHIHRYTYRFIRKPTSSCVPLTESASQSGLGTTNFLHGNITSGEPVTISVSGDPRMLALARGFVLELNPKEIVIGVDHVLSTEFIQSRRPSYGSQDDIIFRIDKDDLMGGMGRVRDNLAQLFYASSSRRLLERIVDLKPPEFDPEVKVPSDQCMDNLNASQRFALEHSLRARDYALILGMPGTGKTTTVAYMIKGLVEMGKTVLLTSYTHSAVDTILLKLKNMVTFDVLRLGNIDKIHAEIQEFTLNARQTATTVEQSERQLLHPPVVATTALSTDHALFSRRRFDYCIVDEASQITLPTCIGPLRFADKFILVGDHFQLPPLVKSRRARKGGFDKSLFRRLSDAHSNSVVDLAYQYRMNADIMLLSNKLIYNDRLQCGSSEVANRSLRIPRCRDYRCPCDSHEASCWIRKIMDESCKAIFVDTDELPALDSRVGDLIQNEVEARLVQQLTLALLTGGVREEQIGVISLYRQQIKLLSHLLEDHKGIEILTADKSQGRDKDCIIISLVRANKENQIGDLLKDWRRINVAFTRARAKLVIFGSRKTLKASPLLSDFFELMQSRGWVLTLPSGADTLHPKMFTEAAGTRPKVPKDRPMKTNSPTQRHPFHPKKLKQASIASSLIHSRPILRDVLNSS